MFPKSIVDYLAFTFDFKASSFKGFSSKKRQLININ